MNRPTEQSEQSQAASHTRYFIRRLQIITLTAAACLFSQRIAFAGLLTDVSFVREIIILGDPAFSPPTDTVTSPVFMGNSLPAHQTFDIASPDGDIASATYTFSDNGSAAEFKINTAFTVAGIDGFQEGDIPNTLPIEFTTTEPLAFTLTLGFSVFHSTPGDTVEVTQPVLLNSILGSAINVNAVSPPSGVLPGNLTFDLLTLFAAGSQLRSGIVGGSSSFDLVLTPVPEPSSIALLAVGVTSLLIRASRRSNLRGARTCD